MISLPSANRLLLMLVVSVKFPSPVWFSFSLPENHKLEHLKSKSDCGSFIGRALNWPTVQLSDQIEYDWMSVKLFLILLRRR